MAAQGAQGASGDRVQELLHRLEHGVADVARTPDGWRKVLRQQGSLWRYSFCNQLLVLWQRPDATAVAGYGAWQRQGRQVTSGEHGISILAPVLVWRNVTEQDDAGTERQERRQVLAGFRVVSVFDVAQTVAVRPEASKATGADNADADSIFTKLAEWSAAQGVPVTRGDTGTAHGYYTCEGGRRIVVSERLASAAAVETLAHEVAHSLLHPRGYADKPRPQAELEAESTAFVVVQALGLGNEASDQGSFAYVASWDPDPKDLLAAGERIASAARRIIVAVLGHTEGKDAGGGGHGGHGAAA